ncbi:MAG: MFS transporter, partial [Victivallaceae bacterium]
MDQISYSPRQIKRGMTISIWAAVLWSFYAAFVGGPIMSGLEVALDFSPKQIALINSLGGVFVPLQLIGLYVQERFFHRTHYWGFFSYSMFSFFGLLGVLVWFYGRFSPAAGFILFACTYAGVLISSNAIAPIGMTWHAEFVPKAASNAFWSKRNGMYMLFSMISGIISGIMLDHWGSKDVRSYTYMLMLGTFFGYISSFIQMKIPDPNPYPRKDRENPFNHIKEVAKHRTFRTVTLFFCLQAAGGGICGAFTNVYLIRTMQMDMKTLQILGVIAAAVSFIASYFFQIVGTKYGRKPVLVLCTLLVAGEYLLYATLFPGNTVLDDFANSIIARICTLFGAGTFHLPPGVFSVLPIFLMIGFTAVGIAAAQQSLLTSQG